MKCTSRSIGADSDCTQLLYATCIVYNVWIGLCKHLYCIEYDYVPPPTEVPHHYGNIPSGDPLTTENSAYSLRDNQKEEELSKCRHNLKDVLRSYYYML